MCEYIVLCVIVCVYMYMYRYVCMSEMCDVCVCAGGTNITCDQGWGCTLRCGQMVMGNTLLHKHLGRGQLLC